MKTAHFIAIAFFLGSLASQASAQDQIRVSGEQTLGVRQITLDNNSAKFNEYRDLRDGLFLDRLRLDVYDPGNKWALGLNGEKLLRDDQRIFLRLTSFAGRWNAEVDYNMIPHRLSNKAMSPYIYQGNGLFTLPAPVPIIKDGNIATGTPSLVPTTGEMLVNDALIAKYLETFLHSVAQDTRRERAKASFDASPTGPLKLSLAFLNERRTGSRSTYGPIGDRPPRTLNAQLPEPVNSTTREVQASADYAVQRLQMQVNYLFSAFDNSVNALRWENMFFAPDAGLDFVGAVAGTPRNVSSFGQRSLAPDNFAHTVSLSAGLNLPLRSRLTSTAAFGIMRQNQQLLPYSASTLGGDSPPGGDGLNWNDTAKLPRTTADAEMRTTRIDVEYSINPINRLNLRPFVRYFNLDNRTPIDDWKYVTQDVAGTNGSVNYRNYRRNLAYAHEKLKVGVDARHYFPLWRTSIGVGVAQERIDREFREANTDENILEATVRTSPVRRLTLSARYLYGDRSSDGYDFNVTSQSYWYSFEQGAADVDNPKFLFGNHPDSRKYDVSDRTRNELRLSATFIASGNVDLNTSYRYRNDDFDSDVAPVAPIAGTSVPLPNPADANAVTPGKQLGLLKDTRHNVTANVNIVPSAKWRVTLFGEREIALSDQRGMVFNENQRREPSNAGIQSPAQLGPWTDADRLFETGSEETTNTLGVGVSFDAIPGRLRFFGDVSLSSARVDLDYSGYGSDAAFLGRDWETFQFGFNDPGTVKYDQSVLNASLEYTLRQNLMIGIHYFFSYYNIQNWVQEPSGPWVEQVGSEFFLRDTSRDNRWGNRLVGLGGYLAPSYQAHATSLTLTYRF